MIPPVLSTGALTPASVSPVISPGRLACGYALSDYGRKAAAILVILRNRILRPIAGSIFDRAEAFTENQLEASSSIPSDHQILQRPDRLTQSGLTAQAPETWFAIRRHRSA